MDMGSMEESEYDSQLFGFTIEHFIKAFKMLVHEEVTRLTNAMASSLKKKCPVDNLEENELIENIRINLVREYMNNAEKSLSVLKTELKELLHIPPHVLLPEDSAQRTQYSAEEEEEMNKLLDDQFQQLKRVKAFKVELLQELKMLQDVLPDLIRRVEQLESLTSAQQKKEEDLQIVEPAIEKLVNNSQALINLGDHLKNDQL